MQEYFFYYTARPINYRDQVNSHLARVTEAGGQGVDVDWLESYYRMIGENLLAPRGYLNLKCGYILDEQQQVAYIFCPHGADMHQADPALRATISQDAHANPALLFTGSQFYEAVDNSRYNIGNQDIIAYAYLAVAPQGTGWLFQKGAQQAGWDYQNGAYGLHLYDSGNFAESILTTDGVPSMTYARVADYFTPGVYLPFGMFFQRQQGRQNRIMQAGARYAEAFDNAPPRPAFDDINNSQEPYRVGVNLRASLRDLLQLPRVGSGVVHDNVWNLLDAQ